MTFWYIALIRPLNVSISTKSPLIETFWENYIHNSKYCLDSHYTAYPFFDTMYSCQEKANMLPSRPQSKLFWNNLFCTVRRTPEVSYRTVFIRQNSNTHRSTRMWWSYKITKALNIAKQNRAKQQYNNCNNNKTITITLNIVTGLHIIRHYNLPSVTWPFILVGVKPSVTFQISTYSKSNRSPSVSWCRFHYNGTEPSVVPYMLLQTTPYVINIKYQSNICDI